MIVTTRSLFSPGFNHFISCCCFICITVCHNITPSPTYHIWWSYHLFVINWFTGAIVLHDTSSPVYYFSTSYSTKSISFLKKSFPIPIQIRRIGTMKFFTGTLSHIAIDLTPLACDNSTLERQRIFCTQRSDLQESSWLPLDGLGISIQQGKTCSKSTNLGRNPTLQL